MTTLDQSVFHVDVPIVLRMARQDDLPKLEWYGQYIRFRNVFRRTFRDQRLGRRIMLLATSNDFPIGQLFILLQSFKFADEEDDTPAYFYAFRVMEMFRDRGIGTRLIEEGEALVLSQGITRVRIAVARENHKARQLYERLGYKIYGQDEGKWSYLDHKGAIRHENEPCWLLEKTLESRYT